MTPISTTIPTPSTDLDADGTGPCHLLIVDDELQGLELLIAYLRDFDFAVSTALGGAEGLEKAQRDRPDLILLDLAMPAPDGFQVLARLKADRRTDKIPVLLLTGRDDDASKVRGFELGAADYVTKPVSEAELHARVTAQLRLHQALGALESRLRAYRQRYGQIDDNDDSDDHDLPKQEVKRLYRARQLLRERLADPPTLNELAQTLGTNQPRLSRGFRALFGTTVFGFLREARMQRARELLTTTQMPIKSVALTIGYSSPSDLTRAIKERFGMTPSELRERLCADRWEQ